jgi:hypothetical protein
MKVFMDNYKFIDLVIVRQVLMTLFSTLFTLKKDDNLLEFSMSGGKTYYARFALHFRYNKSSLFRNNHTTF